MTSRLRAALLAVGLAGAACGAMVATPAPAGAAGPRVFLVGDSVMQVFRFSYGKPGLDVVSAAYTVDLDAYQCRRLITLGCRPGPSAIEVMRAHVPLPKLMVMTVGHNEKDDFPNKIDTIMREAKALGVETVVWLTYQNVIRPTAYPGNNAAVVEAATRWPEMKVADWDAYSEGKLSWFSTEDGLHLTPQGALEYGRFIKAAIDQQLPPEPPPARCSPAAAIGSPAPPAVVPEPEPPATGHRVQPITPVRLVDTRSGQADDGVTGRVGAGRFLDVTVAGRAGVPSGAVGALLNITVVDPCAAGYLTVYPSGEANPPLASSANFGPGEVVAALASTRLGANGKASILTSAQADLIVDVVGFLHPSNGSLFQPVEPFRVIDTRPTGLPAGGEVAVPIRGAGGGAIPSGTGVAGVLVNLTVTQPAAAGYLTAYPGPCRGAARPATSSLNHAAFQTIANLAVVPVGSDGSICVYSDAPAQVVVDAAGWLSGTGARLFDVNAQRLVDTRPAAGALHDQVKGRLAPGVPLAVPAGPSSGVPATATAVALSVTVVAPSRAGYLTVFPCGSPVPLASNVNYAAGEARPNLVAVKVGAGDQVCLTADQPTDVVVDLAGWFA